MISIVFFNNKGGVGKTSLTYHVGFAFAELGRRVLFADFDPQANLSSMCLEDEDLERIFNSNPRPTIYGAIKPLKDGVGDVEMPDLQPVSNRVALISGDLQLSEFEDELSQQWPKCLDKDARAFRVTTALERIVNVAATKHRADIVLLDVGPNFGAINRAALICADHVVVPVAPDLFSMQGLENVGPKLAEWRENWRDRRERAPTNLGFKVSEGRMAPLGYVVSRHSVLAGGVVKAFQRWIERMPATYRKSFFPDRPVESDIAIDQDNFCLARLKDYRSLMPMAQEAKKPMFLLRPGDGAIGGHQRAVQDAYKDFRDLALSIEERIKDEG